jgi:hypothetical protein
MSATTMNLTGKEGKIFGTLSFEESGHCWHIDSEAEPNFQRTFSSQQDAFYFWYSRFDPTTGKLRG